MADQSALQNGWSLLNLTTNSSSLLDLYRMANIPSLEQVKAALRRTSSMSQVKETTSVATYVRG